MPTKWVVDYYNHIADKILPFFQDRNIDVNQIFDHENVFRRHEKDGKKWIRIKDQKRLEFWTNWHAWSFYPHLAGDKDIWFALDIDPGKCNFECVKIATLELAKILESLDLKYLLKFSGNKGFHFLFALGEPPAKLFKGNQDEKIWEFEKNLVSALREKLENNLQKSKHRPLFYKFLKKDDPITIDESPKEKEHNSILLDKLILHKYANIRAPYSLHEATKLVSIPIYKNQIINFNPAKDADPKTNLQKAARFITTKIPQNNISKLKKLLDI